jgi:hypothetical protein
MLQAVGDEQILREIHPSVSLAHFDASMLEAHSRHPTVVILL